MTKIKANQADIEDILNDPSAGATETKKGSVEIATQVEVDAGTDTLRSITPDTLSNAIVTQGGGLYEPLDVTILRTSDINPLGEQILSSGDIGSTVSSVSHLHVGIYEPAFTHNTGFNLNLGTIAGTVSEGDHTHALNDLTDVVIGGSPLLTGHVLTYDGADWINKTSPTGVTDHDLLSNNGGAGSHATITSHIADSTIHFSALDGLSDVVVAGSPGVTNQVLTFDGSNWVNADVPAGGSVALNDLTDVTLGSPVTNEVLTFDGTNWINAGTTGETNKNWLVADNGDNFANAPASVGVNSIALGDNASTSTDTNSIAFGTSASTLISGKNIAIGYSARSLRGSALAIGYNADADGADSIAIGNTALARDPGQVIIGNGASGPTSNGYKSIAIGDSAVTQFSGAIAIGGDSEAGYSGCVAIGRNTSAGISNGNSRKNVALGAYCEALSYGQLVVGWNVKAGSTTTNLNYAVKIGYGTAGIHKNMLHLIEKGKLELVGDEAQYIFPSYAVTGSPVEVPANSIEGGVIYDSVAKGLELYDGTSWSAIGGGGGGSVALNDLTDVTLGSPVTNQVLTFDGVNWINAGNTGEANNNWLVADAGNDFATAPDSGFSGSKNIAIGNGAIITNTSFIVGAIAIGTDADVGGTHGVAIGQYADASDKQGVALGFNTNAGYDAVAIGNSANAAGSSGQIAIGKSASATISRSIAIGQSSSIGVLGISAVAIGELAEANNQRAVAVGRNVVAGGSSSGAFGAYATVALTRQFAVGTDINNTVVTSDVSYSIKLGYGATSANKNLLHLFSKGKLELYGDEAQYIFPSYAVTGSPIEVPANSIEGGVIYDSAAKGLELYDGTSWSAIGGGGSVALNDLTDVIVAGSPAVNGQVLTFDGANWINSTPGVVNNWITGNNGSDFTLAPSAGARALAAGHGANAGNTDATALGYKASATGIRSIAIGHYATAPQGGGISIGQGSDAIQSNAIALGKESQAKETATVAIGNYALANTGLSIAIGRSAADNSTGAGRNVVIGSYANIAVGLTNNSVLIGKSSTISAGMFQCTVVGATSAAEQNHQVVIGPNISATDVTTDVAYSLKIGSSDTAGNERNIIHLHTKGHFELYGDESQIVFPNYIVTGSPVGLPASADEGAVIYDSVAKGLELYDGTSWSAIGGGATATKPTYEAIVISGSPVSAVVTTTVLTVALTGNPLLAGLLVFRNGAQQSEGVMTGSPLEPSEDFAVTGANELTFGTGVLEVGNKINIYVFE